MKDTIEQLWNGSLVPAAHCGEEEAVKKLLERNRQLLKAQLNEAQGELFEKYLDCAEEYDYYISRDAFSQGFCLACRLMSEAFTA